MHFTLGLLMDFSGPALEENTIGKSKTCRVYFLNLLEVRIQLVASVKTVVAINCTNFK